MNKYILSIFCFLIINSVFTQENTAHCSKRSNYTNQLKYSPYVDENQIIQQKKYDVTFYKLSLNMTNTTTDLSGIVEIHANSTQAIDSALLEFYDGFTINEIKVNGVNSTFARYGSLLSVPLNLPNNSSFIISVDYIGTPPIAGSNPFGSAGVTNATSSSWGNQITWTLSEPFSARDWFPCKQDLKDKADSVQLNITVPSTLMAGANGILDSVTTVGGFKTFHWMHRHPIAYYLISVAVGRYQEYTIYANPAGATQPVMIQNYIYDHPNFLNYNQANMDETADMMELFADLFGPYPYQNEKYGHCIAPLGGGMEHQTMTTQGFFERSLTAHELAHQWWGNHVTCGSWADIWINEGFASYSEYLMLNDLYSYNEAQQNMNSVHNNVMSQVGGSTWVSDSLSEQSIFSGRLVYDKGGAIIHTLRYIINDDNLFFNMLKGFQVEFSNRTATGLEFKEFAEEFTGMDFSDFFNQWYFGEGYPTYSVEYKQINDGILVKLNQTTSKPSVTPLFTNPIDLRVIRSGGLGDTLIRVNVSQNEMYFTIPEIANFQSINGIDTRNYIINKVGIIIQNNTLSVQKIEDLNTEILLYPNPTAGHLKVEFSDNQKRTVRIFNVKGKIVLEKEVQSTDVIDVSKLEKGQYLIELTTDNQTSITRKVIKM